MIDGRASVTAAWVAAWRGLGESLPPGARLVDDPFGLAFGGRAGARLRGLSPRKRRIAARVLLATRMRRIILWMQLRTKVIDEVLLAFAREGEGQIVLLGAGFDCRALRLGGELRGHRVFEVDHPATQAHKRRVVAGLGGVPDHVRFIPWDFERDALAGLPASLAEHGHAREIPTLTIWEGVVMYLSRPVVTATLDALAAMSAPGSELILNYTEPATIAAWRAVARLAGERVHRGWRPHELKQACEASGLSIVWDRADTELAKELLAPAWARRMRAAGGRIALARRTASSLRNQV